MSPRIVPGVARGTMQPISLVAPKKLQQKDAQGKQGAKHGLVPAAAAMRDTTDTVQEATLQRHPRS